MFVEAFSYFPRYFPCCVLFVFGRATLHCRLRGLCTAQRIAIRVYVYNKKRKVQRVVQQLVQLSTVSIRKLPSFAPIMAIEKPLSTCVTMVYGFKAVCLYGDVYLHESKVKHSLALTRLSPTHSALYSLQVSRQVHSTRRGAIRDFPNPHDISRQSRKSKCRQSHTV